MGDVTNVSQLDVDDHDGSAAGFKLAGTLVTSTAAELNILDGVTATAAELNAAADVSGRLVAQAAGNFALTAATHGNRITLVDDADVTITLPAATATGDVYKVIVVTTAWTGGTIQAASAADSFLGGLNGVDDDADAAYAWKAESADDTITGNGAATGGKVGDWYQFTDVATGLFLVEGFITQSGGAEATPFSAAVA
jgi:hypothetical protein